MLTIRHLQFGYGLVLAPMAGFTDLPVRLLAKKLGADLVCSEMVSSHGLVQGAHRTLDMLHSDQAEWPLSVQIFGSIPQVMAQAAEIAGNMGASIIDINMGCPVKKILRSGSGAALLTDQNKIALLLAEVRKATDRPLTVKIRSGIDAAHLNFLDVGKIAEDAGVDALTLHPRHVRQGFGGLADWSLIKALKQAVSIPVIGNGDIISAETAIRMVAETGCDGVMIGRAALGNPWLFRNIKEIIEGRPITSPDMSDIRDVMLAHLNWAEQAWGPKTAGLKMRSFLCNYVRGIPGSSGFRKTIQQTETPAAARDIIQKYFDQVSDNGGWGNPHQNVIDT
ncbi:MAG: tRNA dihydrouridine synthase DusB [Deltaproteobacteria bacterium]|nr:tRNA dihydrouridine synthase DusB [Deltaproteobacteria bacterium]